MTGLKTSEEGLGRQYRWKVDCKFYSKGIGYCDNESQDKHDGGGGEKTYMALLLSRYLFVYGYKIPSWGRVIFYSNAYYCKYSSRIA